MRFRQSLYRPEAVKRLLGTVNLEQALAQAAAADGGARPAAPVKVEQVLPPVVAITSPAGPGEVRLDGVRFDVRATAHSVGRHPVTALRLLVDGRPYQGRDGVRAVDNPRLGEVRASWAVELTAGPHTLAAQAESAVSKAVSPAVEVVCRRREPQPEPANLYVLAVGVSDYPGPNRLYYAAADAEAIAQTFQEKARGLFGRVETKVVTDRAATRSNILTGLGWLKERMTPRDVGIFFYAGHGARDLRGVFYLQPAHRNPAAAAATCVSGEEIKRALEAMPGRLILMLDACHSGAAAASRTARAWGVADDLVRDLATEDYGVIVMCSSQGREYSLESPAIEHGLFTMGLVEGLTGQADADHDQVVFFAELDRFATRRVRELSQRRQNPVTARPPTVRSFPLTKP